MTQVTCSKKFVVGKFLNFKMNDAKPVAKQVEELQIIIYEMEVEGMGINSNFFVGSIIEKLPQSWKNFKLYLKHLTDDMSFEQLVLKIRVEEDNEMNEKADANSIEPNANMVGESSSKSKSNHKNKGKISGGYGQKHYKDGKKDYTQQNKYNFKKVYNCWVCWKPGHKAKDCHHKKEHGGATKHICNSRRMFVSYQKVNELEPMFMGNGPASKIEGKGKVILKLTSRKDLVLSNMLHVPNITKNLISSTIISNKGFKLVFKSEKFVITKGGVYVGKGYLDEGLFKLSVVTDDHVINNNNNTAGTSTASVYMIDLSFLWHSRLGHRQPAGSIALHRPVPFWERNRPELVNSKSWFSPVTLVGSLAEKEPWEPCYSETDIQEKDKNQSQNDKTEHEKGKSIKRSQNQSQVKQSKSTKSSQSQPRKVDLERASKTKPENLNCQKLAIQDNHWGMIALTQSRVVMEAQVRIEGQD
ncbi:pol polyprotein [Tanacetum coccineum]